jgi:hypothetical protein
VAASTSGYEYVKLRVKRLVHATRRRTLRSKQTVAAAHAALSGTIDRLAPAAKGERESAWVGLYSWPIPLTVDREWHQRH